MGSVRALPAMTTADAEPCAAAAAAADIICSLRAADLAGWTPPWGKPTTPPTARDEEGGADARELAWPAVTRGKRSRSRRGSPSASGSASAAPKKRPARGSPASPLDYSGASTSSGDDGAFCSPVAASAGGQQHVEPTSKQVGLAGRRSILPVPPPRPAGQRPRKKMRLPEVQQVVRSLSVENDALREEVKALQRACRALSKENGKLETRLDKSAKQRDGIVSDASKGKAPDTQHAGNGFALPDLNLPAQD